MGETNREECENLKVLRKSIRGKEKLIVDPDVCNWSVDKFPSFFHSPPSLTLSLSCRLICQFANARKPSCE